MQQTGIIVTLVEVFEDTGEDLGFPKMSLSAHASRCDAANTMDALIRKLDLFRRTFEELASKRSYEKGRQGKNVLMSSEETLVTTDHQSDDRASQGTVGTSTVRTPKSCSRIPRFLTHLPTGGLFSLSCSFAFACSVNDLLLGFTALPARSFEAKERLNIVPEVEGDSGQVTSCAGTEGDTKERQKISRRILR